MGRSQTKSEHRQWVLQRTERLYETNLPGTDIPECCPKLTRKQFCRMRCKPVRQKLIRRKLPRKRHEIRSVPMVIELKSGLAEQETDGFAFRQNIVRKKPEPEDVGDLLA